MLSAVVLLLSYERHQAEVSLFHGYSSLVMVDAIAVLVFVYMSVCHEDRLSLLVSEAFVSKQSGLSRHSACLRLHYWITVMDVG
jgi:hypothetical protein